MENKADQNLFREVHRQVQDLRDKARKNRNDAMERSRKVAEDEAKAEAFDRPATVPSVDGTE